MGKKRFSNNIELISNVMKQRHIPIVTLDEKWLAIFPDDKQSVKQRGLVKKINSLLARQSGLGQEIKSLKVRKTKVMQLVVDNMEKNNNEAVMQKLQDEIKSINIKIEDDEEELTTIGPEIERVNEELVLESMSICYTKVDANAKRIKSLASDIETMRKLLKEKIIENQELVEENDRMYTYMHDLLGAQVIDEFDKADGQKRR